MTGRVRDIAVAVAIGILLVGMSASCGDDDDPTTFTTIGDAADGTGDAELQGFVVARDGVAKLCEALLESFPPQCGEPSLEIANPELLGAELTTAQGVSWTDLAVSVSGSVEAGVLTLGP